MGRCGQVMATVGLSLVGWQMTTTAINRPSLSMRPVEMTASGNRLAHSPPLLLLSLFLCNVGRAGSAE